MFRQLARVSTATITKSEEMQRALPARWRERNHVIPNGVDLELFRPLRQDEARAQLGWSQDERTVLFVGDPAIRRKNHALASLVCRDAVKRVPELRLRVASGVPPAEIPVLMGAADVLLLTSLWEGSPNVVKEAMACELPVVASPVGDVAERLRGVDGCFVTAPEVELMSGAVVSAIAHGRAPAARAAVSAISLERVARQLLTVYRTAVEHRDPLA